MADYIDSNIICESYLYVEAYDLTADKKARIEHFLASYARTRAPLFFDTELFFDVEIKEGSLKAKVKIVGSLAALIIFYGSFRTGIDYIYKDSQFIASGLVTESIFAAGVRRPQVSRAEVRTGVPGALKRVISKIDNLAMQTNYISPEDFSEQLAGIRAEVVRVLDTVNADNDKEAVASGFEDILNEKFPPGKNPIPESSDDEDVKSAAIKRSDIDDFIRHLKSIRASLKKK